MSTGVPCTLNATQGLKSNRPNLQATLTNTTLPATFDLASSLPLH